MSWSFISSDNSAREFELRHDGEHVFTLTVNAEIGTFRVEGEDEDSKRLFVVRKEGFWKNKLVLRNEYGVKVGQIVADGHESHQGTLEMGDDVYRYEWKADAHSPEITITGLTSSRPLLSFRLLQQTGRASAAILRKGMDTISSELLMAFCWHNELNLRNTIQPSPQALAV